MAQIGRTQSLDASRSKDPHLLAHPHATRGHRSFLQLHEGSLRLMTHDLVVLFEHPEWQKPLWAALDKRGIKYAPFDLKQAAFDPDAVPDAKLYFNQASPSAYVRNHT